MLYNCIGNRRICEQFIIWLQSHTNLPSNVSLGQFFLIFCLFYQKPFPLSLYSYSVNISEAYVAIRSKLKRCRVQRDGLWEVSRFEGIVALNLEGVALGLLLCCGQWLHCTVVLCALALCLHLLQFHTH